MKDFNTQTPEDSNICLQFTKIERMFRKLYNIATAYYNTISSLLMSSTNEKVEVSGCISISKISIFMARRLCGNDCFKGFSDNKMIATKVLRVNYNLRQSPNLRNKLHLIEKIPITH